MCMAECQIEHSSGKVTGATVTYIWVTRIVIGRVQASYPFCVIRHYSGTVTGGANSVA